MTNIILPYLKNLSEERNVPAQALNVNGPEGKTEKRRQKDRRTERQKDRQQRVTHNAPDVYGRNIILVIQICPISHDCLI